MRTPKTNLESARARDCGLSLVAKLALAAVLCATSAIACAQGEGVAAAGPTEQTEEKMDSPVSVRAPIVGRWFTPDQEATIEIYLAKDGKHYGKLVAARDSRAKTGGLILRELEKKGDGWKGTIYVPQKDRIVGVTVHVEGDRLKLDVSAGFRDKTVYWTRAK
jgi:uncharacterized protein (DUF2147 family)